MMMNTPETPPVPVSEYRFPCDACGSDLRYDPAGSQLGCDHCGNTQPIDSFPSDTGTIRVLDLDDGLRADLPGDEMEETRVSACPSCGAQVSFDAGKHAAECPFCATPVVVDTGTSRHIKPHGLLPFALEEETARDAMTKWLGSLWFAPGGLQEYARKGRRMQGIYVPYWSYNADTTSGYRGERGTIYYVTRTVMRDGKSVQEREQKIRWRRVTGRVRRFFSDVLVLASTSLPKKYADALEPWDLEALTPYAPQYLAGFRAEAYVVSLKDGFAEATRRMDDQIRRDVRRDIGGDHQRVHGVDTQMRDKTFRHVLLPIWLAAYKYQGKTYRFVVNGRTGEVQGERPYSYVKIAIAVILGLIVAGGVAWLVSQQ
jgi:predicted RNA-binding Zn-ribbon protein involved in translation (DUF1610 family)